MTVLSLQGRGYAESGFGADRDGASIDFVAASNWGNSNVQTDMIFKTAGSGSWSPIERMRISANGNVGVGTSNPGAKLHVNGASAFENNAASSAGPTFSFWKSRNYAATQNGDELGFISFYGHSGSGLYRSAYIL